MAIIGHAALLSFLVFAYPGGLDLGIDLRNKLPRDALILYVCVAIGEARDAGADLLCGGEVDGALMQPAVLENVPRDVKLTCSEVFGPIVTLVPFKSFDEAVARANATPYGLATGVFTGNLNEVLASARDLDVGNIHINETSSSRVDLMPYGGIKDSGFGKEGPPHAIYEMMEEKLVTIAANP